jgi:ABC-type Fe3+ transport system substrate-binding protein
MRSLALAVTAAAAFVAAGMGGIARAQDFPAPSDEAALYDAAKKEGSVTWYGGFPPDVMKSIMDEFAKKYPGIAVDPVRLVSVQQFQRFQQESQAGQGVTDLVYLDTWSIDALAKQGFIAEWVPPTADKVPPDGRVGNYAYIQAYAASAIAYNANKVTPEEVEKLRDWKGILDPVFKGRFSVANQSCSTCYTPLHMFLDPALKDKYGEQFLRDIAAQKPHVYAEINLAVDRVAAGEEDIVYCCLWGALANARYVKGAPIRWIFPTPTPVAPQNFIAVSALAPHPNAARLFMNWWISADGLRAQQKYFGDGSALAGVSDDMPAVKEAWYKPPTETYKLDRERWNKNFAGDMELWQKILQEAR